MCVIYYEDRVQEWPWLHLIQYASDEISEFVPTGEGMIDDFEMNDTIQGNGRKNLIPGHSQHAVFNKKLKCIPFTMTEEVAPPSMVASRGPGITSSQSEMVEMAFICKH